MCIPAGLLGLGEVGGGRRGLGGGERRLRGVRRGYDRGIGKG